MGRVLIITIVFRMIFNGAKENINDPRIEFVENTSEIQDLKLMSKCKGAV